VAVSLHAGCRLAGRGAEGILAIAARAAAACHDGAEAGIGLTKGGHDSRHQKGSCTYAAVRPKPSTRMGVAASARKEDNVGYLT